jgi:hypothetical protein
MRRDHELGAGLLEGLAFLRTHPPPDVRQLGLARPQHGHAGGRVGRDLDDDAVEIREALHEVARVLLEDDADALLVRLEHEGTGPDDGVGMVEVLELLLGLAGQDHAERGVGEMVQEGRVRLLERDAHGMAVDDLDPGHRLEARVEARLGREPIEGILHVLRRHLAAVHGRLVVELDALAQGERVDLAVLGDRPLLGEVGQDREIRRVLLLGTVGEAHELAVAETDVGVRQKADRQVGIEARCLPLGDAEDAAPLRLLRQRRARDQQPRGQQDGHGRHPSSTHDTTSSFVGGCTDPVERLRVANYRRALPLVNDFDARGRCVLRSA